MTIQPVPVWRQNVQSQNRVVTSANATSVTQTANANMAVTAKNPNVPMINHVVTTATAQPVGKAHMYMFLMGRVT